MKSLATSARTAEVENLLVAAHFLLGMLVFPNRIPDISLLDCPIPTALPKNEVDRILSWWDGGNFDEDRPEKEPNIFSLAMC